MADSVYVVTTTLGPQYEVGQDEYENLVELGLVASLDEVVIPAAQVIVSPSMPTSPAFGTVWFNTSIP